MIKYEIEVAVSEEINTTERGKILEALMRDVFGAMNYDGGPPTRITGMEIDIPATNKVSGEKILAECKAHRENLPAEALAKLLGNVYKSGFDEGWMVTTSKLTKDAEGWKTEWEENSSDARRKLQIFTPDRLLSILVESKRIVDIREIDVSRDKEKGTWYLLITNFGRFWANVESVYGLPSAVHVFYAESGERVGSEEIVKRLKSTDTSLAGFEWIYCDEEKSESVESIGETLSVVVDVAVGDNWADYRPARPQDFVGRVQTLQQIHDFLEDVRTGNTDTRLFSIRSPSGWGKSSLVAKLRAKCSNLQNHNKFFMVAVDMRAAKSSNYVSAAVLKAFSKAIENKFIFPPVLPLESGAPATVLDSESLQDCLQQLRTRERVIILVFDQFEEVLTKPELRDIFERLRLLSLSIDAQKEKLVVGFSWKSDAFLPQEHPAYYLWHQMMDRRLDYQIPIFNSKDISRALGRFQAELEQKLNPVLKSQLIQHSQGFPWLLKKLCIHVFNLVRDGMSQAQVLEKGLDVKSLFEADLNEISKSETLCLKEIARLSPVEWIQIVTQFGNETYTSLLNKRLIIRSGDRINPYWDIFRDYLITGEAPQVPVSFLPGTEVRTLLRGAIVTIEYGKTGIKNEDIGRSLSISSKSALNVVRDMIMFSFAERRGGKIVPCIQKVKPNLVKILAETLISGMRKHVFTLAIAREKKKGEIITEAELVDLFSQAFPFTSLREDTRRVYTLRLTNYLTVIGYLERTGKGWVLNGEMSGSLSLMPKSRGSNNFLGDAPPEQVMKLMGIISVAPKSRKELETLHLRNAITCALFLNLVVVEGGMVKPGKVITDFENVIKEAVIETESYKIVNEILLANSKVSAIELGEVLSEELNLPWSKATFLRRGNAMRRWVKWSWGEK